MALDNLIKKVHGKLGKRPKTAAVIAVQLGYTTGQAISRAIAALVASGEAVRVVVDGKPAYKRAA